MASGGTAVFSLDGKDWDDVAIVVAFEKRFEDIRRMLPLVSYWRGFVPVSKRYN